VEVCHWFIIVMSSCEVSESRRHSYVGNKLRSSVTILQCQLGECWREMSGIKEEISNKIKTAFFVAEGIEEME
jgi:hypothetical protein